MYNDCDDALTSVAVDARVLQRALTLIAIDEVNTRAAVLTRLRHTFIYLCIMHTPHTQAHFTSHLVSQLVKPEDH